MNQQQAILRRDKRYLYTQPEEHLYSSSAYRASALLNRQKETKAQPKKDSNKTKTHTTKSATGKHQITPT